MTPEQIKKFAEDGYNRVPLEKEVLADSDTPLSTYLKLADKPYSYLFESAEGGSKWGRYSFIGLEAQEVLKVHGQTLTLEANGQIIQNYTSDRPLAEIRKYINQFKAVELDEAPRFSGGLVGYFGYDTMRYTEKSLRHSVPEDTMNVPDILLMLSESFIVFDNFSGSARFITFVNPAAPDALDKGHCCIEKWMKKLSTISSGVTEEKSQKQSSASPSDSASAEKANFLESVKRIKSYIAAGDVMQVVLSHRATTDFNGKPINIYRALRTLNPSPYMYFLNLKDFYITGSSPEILVRLDDNEITLRPLAGTRKRGETEAQDLALEKELLADPKEIAEHLMLIDLGRNDVGKVSGTGSVNVTEQMVIERYSHVMHISSNITGKIKPDLCALDVLSSALPAGTLSGAPKVRAMEIIDELEPVKRGIYGGAIGHLSWNGNMDVAIALRTAIIKDGKIHNQTGAGIVNDSSPEAEWEEIINKGKAISCAQVMEKTL